MQMRQVFFGAQTPRVSRFPFFQVLLTEGVVGDITIFTKGIDVQEEALSQLTDKFGAPSEQQIRVMQNRLGARFDVVESSWSISGTYVRFTGASRNLDSGTISGTTPRAAARISGDSKDRRSGEPKL
jgi:hypothetical protein